MSDQRCFGFKLARQEGLALITLDNPPAHAWSQDSLDSLRGVVCNLSDDDEVNALIITGEGEKFFCGGADLKNLNCGDYSRDKAIATSMANSFGSAFEALARFRGITIAAINGYAMGGGLECALACDFRVAETHAVLALPELGVGLLPCAGGTQWLPWMIGESWAKRMILLGERVDAPTALKIGLIDYVVDRQQSLQMAKILAGRLNRQSPIAIRASKKLIHHARSNSPQEGLVHERQAFVELFDTKDRCEGVSAFVEKREPVWSNK